MSQKNRACSECIHVLIWKRLWTMKCTWAPELYNFCSYMNFRATLYIHTWYIALSPGLSQFFIVICWKTGRSLETRLLKSWEWAWVRGYLIHYLIHLLWTNLEWQSQRVGSHRRQKVCSVQPQPERQSPTQWACSWGVSCSTQEGSPECQSGTRVNLHVNSTHKHASVCMCMWVEAQGRRGNSRNAPITSINGVKGWNAFSTFITRASTHTHTHIHTISCIMDTNFV